MSKAIDCCKRLSVGAYRTMVGLFGSFLDRRYQDPKVPKSNLVNHQNYWQHLSDIGNHQGQRILEIGSREVTGKSVARTKFANAEYIGFDYYAGSNVDVVGDAHQLTHYFGDEKMDIIFSTSVFEHFAMPWLVATEIAKLLKVGGIVFVETHFSYSSHERPWHFFQFTDMGLRALFSPALGFECIEAGASNPIVGRFSSQADKPLRFLPVCGLYCHSAFLGRKIRDVPDFQWNAAVLDQVVGGTKYPLL